jgi:hypothetical protein
LPRLSCPRCGSPSFARAERNRDAKTVRVRRQFFACWAIGSACLFAVPAVADTVDVSSSITLNFLDGKHDTATSIDRLTFVPLPLLDLDARMARTAVHLEGVPPLTFAYGNAIGGRQQTQLSIINATLRQEIGGGAFVGVGQTIYNQRTTYPPPAAAPDILSVAAQSSRVTGIRYEVGLRARIARPTRIEFVAALNPSMHGLEYTAFDAAAPIGPLPNPERAVQVDTSLRFVTALHRGALVYGLRYLNYASQYAVRGPQKGSLADRNVGFMPLAGYRIRL